MPGQVRHGHAVGGQLTPTYTSWAMMVGRCTNPNNPSFSNYGERGITVCKRWLRFDSFLEDMGKRPANRTLERKDNSKGYQKSNCKWATRKEQARNRRNIKMVTANGITKPAFEWAESFGINVLTIKARLSEGWPPDKAVTTPAARRSL